jgi:hypothetical protein
VSFTDNGSSYEELLNKLRDERSSWDSKETFAECRSAISGISDADPALYDALEQELREYYGGDEDRMLGQLRLSILAWPASDYGLTGAEWADYFISERAGGEEVYALDRFAEPQEWVKLEVSTQSLALTYDRDTGLMYDAENWYLPDGQTVVTLDVSNPELSTDAAGNSYLKGVLQAPTVTDLRKTHFDQEQQRWRRWSDAGGEFEYYHNEDGEWERLRPDDNGNDQWYRYHSAQQGWLRYDRVSDYWLDPQQNQWCKHGDIGAAVTPPASDTRTAVGDQVPEDDEFDEMISSSLESGVIATIEAIREAGVSEDELSDEEIAALFEASVEEMAAAEIPELQQMLGE